MRAVRQAIWGAPMRNLPRSWVYLSVSAAALLLVVTGMLSVAAPASASTAQVVPGTIGLEGVACPSATTCVAVGASASGQGVVVPITHGTPGTPEVVPGTQVLSAIACPSATTCVAVGSNALNLPENAQGVVVTITNGIPGTPQVVARQPYLDGVACPSATSCVAVGSFDVVVPITNGIPGTAQVVSGADILFGVACPTATTCDAVGAMPSPTFVASQGAVVPITNGTVGTPEAVPGTTFLDAIACPSATSCVTLGESASLQEGVVVYQGVVVPITNGTPGTAQVAPIVGAVACPRATTCEVVAGNLVVPITNGTEGTPQIVSSTAGFSGVACPNPTTCVAAGSALGQGVVTVIRSASSTHVPLSVDQCEHGGWQSLTNVQGQPFGNQGQCIAYMTHNPVSLADLTGSFSGTTIPPMPVHECSLLGGTPQSFNAVYPGGSAVGAVTLGIDGCNNGSSYIGAFFIATNVGTLVGDVSGSIASGFELTVLSGTGAFATTTGIIHVSIQVLPGGTYREEPIAGSVTIP